MFWLWVIIGIAGAIGAGVVADSKGRSGVGFFLLGLLFWPLALIMAAAMPALNVAASGPKPTDIIRCQKCSGFMRRDALSCPNCGGRPALPPPPEPMKRCPACAEWIQSAAIKCRYCSTDLQEAAALAAPQVTPGDPGEARVRLIATGVTFQPVGPGYSIKTPAGMTYSAPDQKRTDELAVMLDERLRKGEKI